MPQPVAYIAVVHISDRVRLKIGDADHGHLTPEQVREALIYADVERSGWVNDDERGSWLKVVGSAADGTRLWAVLYPVNVGDGEWNLGTAKRMP